MCVCLYMYMVDFRILISVCLVIDKVYFLVYFVFIWLLLFWVLFFFEGILEGKSCSRVVLDCGEKRNF